MTKLKPSDLFILATGVGTVLISIYLIGKMIFGAEVSTFEFQLMSLLTLVNCVNAIHTAAK